MVKDDISLQAVEHTFFNTHENEGGRGGWLICCFTTEYVVYCICVVLTRDVL